MNVNCRCGHERDAHDHYRASTNCALCPCRHYGRYAFLTNEDGFWTVIAVMAAIVLIACGIAIVVTGVPW